MLLLGPRRALCSKLVSLLLKLLLNALLKFLILILQSHLLLLFFPLLLLNLLLKLLLHGHALLLFLLLYDAFFVTTAENTSLLLKCNIQSTLCDPSAGHDSREVLLRVLGRVGRRCAALLIRGCVLLLRRLLCRYLRRWLILLLLRSALISDNHGLIGRLRCHGRYKATNAFLLACSHGG